jgi:penicillin amidase
MVRAMCRSVFVFLALLAACGDDTVVGPFDELPLDADLQLGLTRPVHVARDRYGVAHIRAQNLADGAFAQGYVMAHDRLPQMDILRRFGAGTLSELFGALDPAVIDTDLEMRMHRMKPLAAETWTRLQASDREDDRQLVVLLQRFADGVNAYATQVRSEENPTGIWQIDPNLLASFDPSRFAPWDPVDSLVLGRFQAFALSWSTPFELDLTELTQKLDTTFEQSTMADPAAYARRGIVQDLVRFTPVGQVPTIDGFPNVTTDTGSRSDGTARRRPGAGAATSPHRPRVPDAVLSNARAFFQRGIHTGAFGGFGPHAFMAPYAGSNNWAVGPIRTEGGDAILASDQHLQLPNPSIFYPTHITFETLNEDGTGGPADVMGVTFPGIPGVILGSNGVVAWAATVSEHDVNDVYLETIAPCAGKSCVAFKGAQVPIETFTEEIKIGALGTITQTKTATYEVVPHHGPIIPTIDRTTHAIVPRTATSAMSVRYTGYEPTFEIRALWNLGHATSVVDGFSALHDFGYGSQNWTMIDANRNIGWTTHANVPVRAPAAYTWNAQTNPGGLAPFFVLPGDGSAEWTGLMSSRYVPHAINPSSGYLVSANADPVGATFDNDPLNQPIVDGVPLYAGVTYAAGVRQERIAEMIVTSPPASINVDAMAAMQHDTKSTMGTKLAPYIVATLNRLEDPSGTPSDLAPFVAGLSPENRARLITARTLLAGWSFQTPTGVEGASADVLADSAATAVFNVWMHFFIERALGDEFTAAGFTVWRLDDNALARIVYALMSAPQTFVQSATTSQPIVCDRHGSPGADESCARIVLSAMVDAMLHLESSAGFGSANIADWQWGKLHRLRITPLFPNTALDLPAPGAPGFPKSGDNFVVNRSDQGWQDLDFSQYSDGPAQRMLAVADGERIRIKWALPGGVIYDSRSPHYRDLLDMYYLAETHFDAPFRLDEIVGAGESRWILR